MNKHSESAQRIAIQDSYANEATWLLSRTINELKARPGDKSISERQGIWDALQSWLIEAPPCMRPVAELDSLENPFATILFASSSAGNIREPEYINYANKAFTNVLRRQSAAI